MHNFMDSHLVYYSRNNSECLPMHKLAYMNNSYWRLRKKDNSTYKFPAQKNLYIEVTYTAGKRNVQVRTGNVTIKASNDIILYNKRYESLHSLPLIHTSYSLQDSNTFTKHWKIKSGETYTGLKPGTWVRAWILINDKVKTTKFTD